MELKRYEEGFELVDRPESENTYEYIIKYFGLERNDDGLVDYILYMNDNESHTQITIKRKDLKVVVNEIQKILMIDGDDCCA